MASDFAYEGGPVSFQPKAPSMSPGRKEAEATLQQIPGVQGVGEGRDNVGALAWIAYVRDDFTASQLPDRIGDRRVMAATSGEVRALPMAQG